MDDVVDSYDELTLGAAHPQGRCSLVWVIS